MKVIVIGDISGGGNYHLGDEAMSKVAVAELRKRGAEVTIIADRPQISAPLYGVPAVRRFELWRCADRAAKLARMDEILAGVRGEHPVPEAVNETVAAVSAADAVIVAGGGNLNSHMTENHLLERVLLKRIAEYLGTPLYVSSQTVGPEVVPEDRALLRELATYARVFGARERATAELMREICAGNGTVVHTLDDVILMDPDVSPAAARERFALPARYVVGSFTMHSGSTGLSREAYYRRVASILDDLSERCDVDVVLLPHMGVLNEPNGERTNSDVYGHQRIVGYAQSGRLRSLEMMASEELAAVTQGAQFTLSTRYHPVVFGAGLGVPAIGLVTSYYSAVRMRGALANVGMESLAIPFEAWSPLFGDGVLAALLEQRAPLLEHTARVGAAQRAYQSAWWDGIVADAAGTGDVVNSDLPTTEPFEWASREQRNLLALARLAQEKTNLEVLRGDIERGAQERSAAALRRELDGVARELGELRVANAELRHRMRPPGAGLRDWLRGRLRGLK